GFPTRGFESGCSTSDDYSWATFDVDGDKRPDLVVTTRCFDAVVGKAQWNVHLNTGSGFAAQPVAWSLPTSPYKFGFPTAGFDSGCSTSDDFSWAPFDVNADPFPDLVVTTRCFDAVVGKTQWNVHLGGAGGFAAQPTAWSLPTSPYKFGFATKDFASGCSTS